MIEAHREEALARGLLVRHGVSLPGTVPVELASGRLVFLDPGAVFYREGGWRA